MKRIHIFKAGQHTATSGVTLDFTDAQLQEAADNYNAELHEAPIVVGHPKDNGPAFGWVERLEFSDGNLYAIPHQVNEKFAEAVDKGSYKKVSASLYTPDSPANPTPGKLYVRHVGFLGAQPPAIKGLEAVQFSEDGEPDTVEFSQEWEVAGVFRRLREFFIEKYGTEDADKAIPGYLVESAEDRARTPEQGAQPDSSMAYYAEQGEQTAGDSTMTEEELKAAQDKLEADQAALKADREAHDAAVASFTEARKAEAVAAVKARVDALVEAGKVTPAEAPEVTAFAESLLGQAALEFGEGDAAESKDPVDIYLSTLEASKPGVDFGEHGAGNGEGNREESAEGLAAKAAKYRKQEADAGRSISFTEAVNHVQGLSE